MRIYSHTFKKLDELGDWDLTFAIGSGQPSIRFGYWRQVDLDRLRAILGAGVIVSEEVIEDDECGYLYLYDLVNYKAF